jgi:hypothetical protein
LWSTAPILIAPCERRRSFVSREEQDEGAAGLHVGRALVSSHAG